ncbi:MAG TPA: acyl-CoA thioesterase domain-containing protein [Novosphingobium sp.]|nr:acyl-CoA thioesterase domain-containing protein [Novosphingobium sp.]
MTTIAPHQPAPSPYPDDPAQERAAAFAFAQTGPDRFRVEPVPSGLLRLYGGSMIAQGLDAARLTVAAPKQAHSLHACFAQPGFTDVPLDFEVTRETDGRSFAQRRVRVTQEGRLVLNVLASFQAPEESPGHHAPMPQVPPPEACPPLWDMVRAQAHRLPERHRPFWTRRQQVDWRPAEPYSLWDHAPTPLPARRHFWLRFYDAIEGGPHVHQRLLAYASDLHIFHTGLGPMGIGVMNDRLQTSSLDHAIWFHADFRVDEWLLYALECPAASSSRMLGRGEVFTQDGRLVASVAQQGLARLLPEARLGRI